jgi:hypothetical protein
MAKRQPSSPLRLPLLNMGEGMNPGATEEAGSTARTLITSLSSTPVVLALVVFNVLYMAFGFYTQVEQGKRYTEATGTWERMVERAMAYCPDSSRTPSPK